MTNMYSTVLKAVVHSGLTITILSGCTREIDDRIASIYELGSHPSERQKNRIEALLKDEDRDIRATALVVMGRIDQERAIEMASGALQDPDGVVRAAAVSIIGLSGKSDARHGLAAMAASDPDWHVRARALDAVRSYDEPAVQDAFARALSDPVRHVRRVALRAGIERPGLLPLDRLAELVVSDPDWENRVDAAHALGASKDAAASAALDAALEDPNEFVRATAALERKGIPTSDAPH